MQEPEKGLSWQQQMLLRRIDQVFGDGSAVSDMTPAPEPAEAGGTAVPPQAPAVAAPAPALAMTVAKTSRRWLRLPSRKVVYWTVFTTLGLVILAFALLNFLPGYNIYVVQSGSMEPALSVGDMIVTGPAGGWLSGDIEIGTIITYDNGHKSVTHRVIAVGDDHVITKGDASEDPDTFAASLGAVEGVLLFSIPHFGHVINFIGTKLGWFLAIILPAALLVFMLVREIVKEALRKDSKPAFRKGRYRISRQSKKHADPA